MALRATIVFLSLTQAGVLAQTAAPQFEVASIKPSAPGARGPTFYNATRERFAITSVTAKALIAYAYDVREFQISGGPGWLGSEEYDVVAKPDGDVGGDKVLAMARALLAERFKLSLHRESKEMPVLTLVVAKGGPKLQPAAGHGPEVRGGRGRFEARNVTMGMFAAQLAGRMLDRPVLDRTGISGEFDINLKWEFEAGADNSSSIAIALQEQLGLKLEAQKGAVDMLVIDRVERPSAN